MKNIIEERPDAKLSGRLRKSFEFVDNSDLKGKTVLDIGCGYGWFEENAFKKGAKSIIGVEISEEDLATVKKYVKNKNFTPKIGHATDIPVKSDSVDTVVAWEVIEHIPIGSEDEFFKEVGRALRKGGVFYLSTPHKALFSTFLDPAFWLIGHRHYSGEQLRSYAMKNKFKVEKIDIVGGIWTSFSVLNMYISKWIFRRERFFWRFFEKKDDEQYGKDGFYNIFVKYRKM